MKVYQSDADDRWLVGCARVVERNGPLLEVNVPDGGGAEIIERFKIGALMTPGLDGAPTIERVILLQAGQFPNLLPGWRPIKPLE